jgi:hypothetical protein
MIDYAQSVKGKRAVYIEKWDNKKTPEENLFNAYRSLHGTTDMVKEALNRFSSGVFLLSHFSIYATLLPLTL